jgi:SAM-dependent MidA family methyltransferase
VSGPLEHLLAVQEEGGGAIPVERYLREALYHPQHGYYARNIRTVGRRGDFATSASLGEALGSALARWLWENRIPGYGRAGDEETSERISSPFPLFPRSIVPGKWHVIEAGAGTGELARTILRRLGLWRRRGLTYHIVETSPVLCAEQKKTLLQFRVRWHDSMPAALAACDGRAVIFSNELIDAFPCRLFEHHAGAWTEIGLRLENGRLREVAIDRPPPASSAFAGAYPDGQRVEIHAAAAEWFATWSQAAREARLLTIDYGDEMPALYHRRPRGTLRAYFHHQRYEGAEIYARFGRQDLTADVNFTDLRAWTEHCGWRTVALTTQTEFLAAHGATHAGLPDAALADHLGAGGAFKVLVSEKLPPGVPPAFSELLPPVGSR